MIRTETIARTVPVITVVAGIVLAELFAPDTPTPPHPTVTVQQHR